MKVDGVPYRTVWLADDVRSVEIIDQTRLPHAFETSRLVTLDDAVRAIRTMQVRGAPLIGATAAYGLCLALSEDASDRALDAAAEALVSTRPTAVNLRWAVGEMRQAVGSLPLADRVEAAHARAAALCDEDVATCQSIGKHGLSVIESAARRKSDGGPVNILTHCNAGWLACVDWGTALAPVYVAHDAGVPVHVWVDETRPRNQGAALTAWELANHGVPHTVIADNAGGHLMRSGRVDLCMTGSDRVAANGDVANKIGTYLKALAARDNGIPFYVAVPASTIDWQTPSGDDIPIEERAPGEVTRVRGLDDEGELREVRLTPAASPAANPAFDITPAGLVTGLVTERGICPATAAGLRHLLPA